MKRNLAKANGKIKYCNIPSVRGVLATSVRSVLATSVRGELVISVRGELVEP